MGTFHSDMGELHGITVAVETRDGKVHIGRYEVEMNGQIILNDADVHAEGEGGKTNAEFLSFAAQFGIWARHKRIAVPKADAVSVRRLGEIAAG